MDLQEVETTHRAWVDAQLELDTHLTVLLPAALVVPHQRTERSRDLTDDQIREVGALYGRVVGAWARYAQALRGHAQGAASSASLNGTGALPRR